MKKAVGIIIRCLLVYMLLLCTVSMYANDGDILDRKIEITLARATKYKYLRQLTDATGYHFVYDSALINNDEEISISPGLHTLRDLIFIIAGSHQIDIKVIGNHIALSINHNIPDQQSLPPAIKHKPAYTIITGRIFDLYSKERIPSATVLISHTGMGTVSNQDGVFRLAIPDSVKSHAISISHIGYENREFNLQDITNSHIDLSLEPKVIPLQEVVIRVINPIQTIQKMLENRVVNYSNSPVGLTVFYREGIEHKKKNVDLTESVLQVYKTGIDKVNARDQVKLVKMRRIIDRQERDTLLTRMKAGIHSALMLDVVKHIPDYLEASTSNEYNYTFTDISVVDNRLVYVISFEQKQHIVEPLFRGELYIDTENFALLQARIQINPEYVEKATSQYVEKTSRKLKLTLRNVMYTLSYRSLENGIYYLNHVRGDLDFRVKRRRKLFSTNLKVWFEMVNCKAVTENVIPIPRHERFVTRGILSETSYQYDPDFWGGMNVIVPEEELKEFILKNLEDTKQ